MKKICELKQGDLVLYENRIYIVYDLWLNKHYEWNIMIHNLEEYKNDDFKNGVIPKTIITVSEKEIKILDNILTDNLTK